MLDQSDQCLFSRLPAACVTEDDGQVLVEVQGHPDVFHVVSAGAFEAVQRHDERYLPALEVVDSGKTAGQPPGIGKDDGPERTDGEFVPHEPEALLAGGAEQVEHQIAAQADPAEIHRDRGRRLSLDSFGAVGMQAALGERFLGPQRLDLTHGTDERGLTHPEASGQQDLYGAVLA